MSNVLKVIRNDSRTIGDLEKGEIVYTIEPAYNEITGEIDEEVTFSHTKLGNASLRVECVESHKYILTFEEPEYA